MAKVAGEYGHFPFTQHFWNEICLQQSMVAGKNQSRQRHTWNWFYNRMIFHNSHFFLQCIISMFDFSENFIGWNFFPTIIEQEINGKTEVLFGHLFDDYWFYWIYFPHWCLCGTVQTHTHSHTHSILWRMILLYYSLLYWCHWPDK